MRQNLKKGGAVLDKYLSVDQVSQVLGVTYKTALKVVNDLPHIKVGGKLIRVNEADLKRWIQQKTILPQGEGPAAKPKQKRKADEDWSKYLDEDGLIPRKRSKRAQTA